VFATPRFGSNDDLHVPAQRVQVADQALHGESVELAGEQFGDLGLTGAKDASRLHLSEMTVTDDAGDLVDEFSLGQELIGLGEPIGPASRRAA